MGGYLERESDKNNTNNRENNNDDDNVNTDDVFESSINSNEHHENESQVSNEASESETDCEDDNFIFISEETFEKFASTIAFFLGLMINWGSLNLLGFMIGLNYNYFLTSQSYIKIRQEIQTIIPTFTLGVLLVHLSLIYFFVSVFVGYVIKSKNFKLPDREFFKQQNIIVNVKNYGSVFHEILGIVGNDLKKES
tara:strand:+ start:1560 stop:2144 length:585 start_codon:yes stop_codon:yes gene_type:complete